MRTEIPVLKGRQVAGDLTEVMKGKNVKIQAKWGSVG